MSVEQEVKQQFAKVFVRSDWLLFKRMAEHYLRTAAYVRQSDLRVASDLKLLARNCQKRLYIGIGVELLLKAAYLKHGFSINKLEDRQAAAPQFPHTFAQVAGFSQRDDDTYTLNNMIDGLEPCPPLAALATASRGLRIAKVFRNKEGHVVVRTHSFEESNYRDMEQALVTVFKEAFQEVLNVRISFKHGEKGVWRRSNKR